MKRTMTGHLCALFCAVVWGTTFLVSKVLLLTYTPLQIMLLRFLLAYPMLWIICPKRQFCGKEELGFLLMSLFGNTLYFLAENCALKYTFASNVSILVSAAPVLTTALFLFFDRKEKVTRSLAVGVLAAFFGMVLVVLNGSLVLKLSSTGDLLGLGAALCWALYNLILPRYSGRYSSAFISRKLTFYSLVVCLPLTVLEGAPFQADQLVRPQVFLSLLFLGLIGSGACYVAWNLAAEWLGVLRTNLYIYAIPFVTMLAGAILFHETITPMGVLGAVLIAVGMAVSSREPKAEEAEGPAGAPGRRDGV